MDQIAYKTVAQENSDAFIINKSRFIGHGAPAQTEEEALAFLSKIRTLHKAANHNCYAYIIGQNAGIQRYSDDGEPGGTAGLPIIEVIKAQNVVNVCVVVTRYFGGILLGAGGLVRAYSQGCSTALKAAQVVVMHKTCRYLFESDYSTAGRIDHWIKDQPVLINEKDYGASVTYDISVRLTQSEAFLRDLTQLTAGKSEPILIDEGYQGWAE